MSAAQVGETFVSGLTRDNARSLLAAAERTGHDPFVVRTTDGGFVVPTEVAEEAATAPLTAAQLDDQYDQQTTPTTSADET